jgi:hypothetical protein
MSAIGFRGPGRRQRLSPCGTRRWCHPFPVRFKARRSLEHFGERRGDFARLPSSTPASPRASVPWPARARPPVPSQARPPSPCVFGAWRGRPTTGASAFAFRFFGASADSVVAASVVALAGVISVNRSPRSLRSSSSWPSVRFSVCAPTPSRATNDCQPLGRRSAGGPFLRCLSGSRTQDLCRVLGHATVGFGSGTFSPPNPWMTISRRDACCSARCVISPR